MLRHVSFRWFVPVALLIMLSLVLSACVEATDDGSGGSDVEGETQASETEESTSGDVEIGGSDLEEAITFADYGWDSALALNRVSQFILEEGYGYDTDATPGETIPLFEGLRQGDIDISMEIWIDQQPAWDEAEEEGVVIDHGTSFGETVQGWYVPTYLIEGDEERGIEPMAPDLESVEDLPDYWELFEDPEDSDKGRFYSGVAGWESEKIDEVKFDYYGLNEDFNRFLPGSGPALATSLVSAYEQGEPWLGYYWGPTWIFGQYDLTMIEEPEYTDECWEELEAAAEEERTPEQACAYPEVPVHIATHADFVEQAPDVVEFLETFEMTMEDVSEILYYMYEEDAEAEQGAMWFLREREDLWTEWVPEEVVDRVRDALESEES